MNAQDTAAIVAFKARMTAVAEKNNDEFATAITIEDDSYVVTVIETADNHTFLTGSGATVQDATARALANLPLALKHWSYEDSNVTV
jgi:hypothetical protein